MYCEHPQAHEPDWEIVDRRREATRIYCPHCQEDWWSDEEDDDETADGLDNYTDALGECFSDADSGL